MLNKNLIDLEDLSTAQIDKLIRKAKKSSRVLPITATPATAKSLQRFFMSRAPELRCRFRLPC